VLVDHGNQAHHFNLDSANVVLMLNCLAGKALGFTENAHLRKEIKILLGQKTNNRLNTRVDTLDNTLSEHLLGCLVAVVAVKNAFQLFLRASRAIVAASSPASNQSTNSANFSAVIVLSTEFTIDTFSDEVTEEYSYDPRPAPGREQSHGIAYVASVAAMKASRYSAMRS
jgi:hypothetical protein